MVKAVHAVIGANYGDEGKGMVSAHIRRFSDPVKTLTVLTNGGAQRGHTVDDRDGSRFVFHHLGASMKGDKSATFCPRKFAVNPLVLLQDLSKAASWAVDPVVYIDPSCPVTTPYDMIADQVEETLSGEHRRGSTGMGVWNTFHRSRDIRLEARDLLKPSALKDVLGQIRSYWFGYFGDRPIPGDYRSLFCSFDLQDNWIGDVGSLFARSDVRVGNPVSGDLFDTVIFENAQGLLLDISKGYHATCSRTGAAAVDDLLKLYDIRVKDPVRLHYVSRTYVTRHGAGPFPEQCPKEFINRDMVDRTNVPNEWQGSLRYGLVDWNELSVRTGMDSCSVEDSEYDLVLTHANEYPCHYEGDNAVVVDNPYMDSDYGLVK